MNNETKPFDLSENNDSLINIDEIISRYNQNLNKPKTANLDEVIYSERVKTSIFNVDNLADKKETNCKSFCENELNDIDKHLEFLNKKLNASHSSIPSSKPKIEQPQPVKNNFFDFSNQKQEDNKTVKSQKLLFEKVTTDLDTTPTTKQNIEDKISFDVDSVSQPQTKTKKFFSFLNKKNVNEQKTAETKLSPSEIKQEKKDKKALLKNIPHFYKFEIFVTNFWLFFNILFFIGSIVTLGLSLWNIFNNGYSYWLLLPQTIFNFITLVFLVFSIINIKAAHKELKINNYVLNREQPSSFIKKKYKSIVCFNILLNWYSFAVYLVWSIAILLTFIVTYFMNLIDYKINEFGLLHAGENYMPMVMVIIFGTLIGLTFVIQMLSFIFNRKRQNEIEIYYQKPLFDDEMLMKYKKSANRKGMVIFFGITFILTFIVLITWLVFKRKAKKAVLVK